MEPCYYVISLGKLALSAGPWASAPCAMIRVRAEADAGTVVSHDVLSQETAILIVALLKHL